MNLTDLSEAKVKGNSFYQEGYDAYWIGVTYDSNPYASDSIQFQCWSDGWMDAGKIDDDHDDRD
jgi:hypothetical protein